jgi:hypothetical protein
MKIQLLIVSLCCLTIATAQLPAPNSVIIDVNNITARFLSDGSISFKSDTTSYDYSFEYPKGSGINAVFSGNFWMRALDDTGA